MTIRRGGARAQSRYISSMNISALYNISVERKALIAGGIASAILLSGAHLFELAGYAPCKLCLDQREAHWAALGVAIAGALGAIVTKTRYVAAASVGALSLVYLVSFILAFYHTGVEHKFWPGPDSCSVVDTTKSIGANALSVFEQPLAGPACSEAAWQLFGVSMAGYNMIASAALFALTFGAAIDASRRAKQEQRRSIIEKPVIEV